MDEESSGSSARPSGSSRGTSVDEQFTGVSIRVRAHAAVIVHRSLNQGTCTCSYSSQESQSGYVHMQLEFTGVSIRVHAHAVIVHRSLNQGTCTCSYSSLESQ